MTPAEKFVFGFIIALYLAIGALFAWRTPAWQAPDEPAHYNYIAQIASGNILPVIQDGDWDNAYLETLKSNRFAPELLDDISAIRYENHQPPLYYWLSTPVYLLTNGNLSSHAPLFAANWCNCPYFRIPHHTGHLPGRNKTRACNNGLRRLPATAHGNSRLSQQ